MSTTAVASSRKVVRNLANSKPPKRRWGASPSDTPAGPLTYLALGVTLLLSAFPLYWMFIVGSSTEEELAKLPPSVTPGNQLVHNFQDVFAQENAFFLKSLWNSFLVSTIVTFSILFFCSLAGFAFAKLKFRGRNALLVLLIGTMTIPNQLGAVALYIMMGKLGWTQELPSVIVPNLVTAFGVFYMFQFVQDAIPDELIEAARVDGASTFRIYWSVVLPTLRPAVGVLGLLTFTGTWNDFYIPFIMLFGGENYTVQVSLSSLASCSFIQYTREMAGAVLATIPLLVVFFLAGKQIVAGIMEGAVKS